jgi:NAD+ synthase (glutamine-hydrolysing)
MRLVKLALAVVNTTVGAFGKNVDRALAMVREMAAQDVTVALFPEQLIGGYPQEDLVQWQRFVDRQWTELERYTAETAKLPIVSCLGVTVAWPRYTVLPWWRAARCMALAQGEAACNIF